MDRLGQIVNVICLPSAISMEGEVGGGLLLEGENAYNANGLVLNSHFAGFVSQT